MDSTFPPSTGDMELLKALEALGRHTCFSAYSASEPLTIRFDFACADDRIAAADALDQAFETLASKPLPPTDDVVERVAKELFWADTLDSNAARPERDRLNLDGADRDHWWREYSTMPLSGPGFIRQWTNLARTAISALSAQSPPPIMGEGLEAAWRDGWNECKAGLTEDEAFCLTADVEEDAWLDSKTAALASTPAPITEGMDNE